MIPIGQSIRQTARKSALASQAKRRRQRAETERRWSALGVDVAVALTGRDVAIERLERAAGARLAKLTRDEGLTLPLACEWADNLPTAEAKRLRRLAEARITGIPALPKGCELTVVVGFEAHSTST